MWLVIRACGGDSIDFVAIENHQRHGVISSAHRVA